MDDDAIAALERAMAKAAADCDFEEAGRLRDQIHALRNGGAAIDADLAGLRASNPARWASAPASNAPPRHPAGHRPKSPIR